MSLRSLFFLGLLGPLLFCGCSQEASTESVAADQQLLDEMLGDLASGADGADAAMAVSATHEAADPVVARPKANRLELRLQPGDRFPLIKTVEQTLNQKSGSTPLTATTRLEMTLALQVEDVQANFVQMGVTYSRIVYSHDLAGQRLQFDSASHQGVVPQDAVPYAGMVNNGFSFQIGRDNKILKLIGYQEFLLRCVQQIPIERRQTLLSEIGQRFGDDGVANFIDDTIGLLPYNTDVDPANASSVIVGDVWTRERRLMQPVPVHITSQYRVAELNTETAEIDITGQIAAGTSVQAASSGGVRINGGHSVGSCSLDLETGLPLELHVTQFVSMVATDSNGSEVLQEKRVQTSIRTFPQARGPVVDAPKPPGDIVPAGGSVSRGGAAAIPTNGGNGTTTAVYPR